MNNIYLLVFDESSRPRARLLEFLKSRPEIPDFHASIPSSLVVLVSFLDLAALRNLLNAEGKLNYFLLVHASANRISSELDGWLPKATWEFIQAQEAKPTAEPPPVPTPAAHG